MPVAGRRHESRRVRLLRERGVGRRVAGAGHRAVGFADSAQVARLFQVVLPRVLHAGWSWAVHHVAPSPHDGSRRRGAAGRFLPSRHPHLRASVALVATLVALSAAPGAAAASSAANDPDQVITILPTVQSLDVEPGQVATFDVTVKNQTELALSFDVEAFDLRRSRAGTDSVELAERGEAPRGAGSWLTLTPQRWQADAATEQQITVTVRVPADARPGGHYAGLLVSADPIEAREGIGVRSQVSMYVFITVAGQFERRLDVDVVSDSRWRWRGGPTEWVVELRNSGDLHENVSGVVTVDGVVDADHRVALDPGILLPGERREQRIRVETRDAPDVLRAKARVDRDEAPSVQAVSSRTIILPWWLLVLVAVATVVIVWRLRTRRRRWEVDPGDGDLDDPGDGDLDE